VQGLRDGHVSNIYGFKTIDSSAVFTGVGTDILNWRIKFCRIHSVNGLKKLSLQQSIILFVLTGICRHMPTKCSHCTQLITITKHLF
jgi:hypothetical protein